MRPRIAIVVPESASGEQGGAERFYAGLGDALSAENVNVTLVSALSDETDLDPIKESYLRFYDLDLSNYDGVISTKGPSYAVRHHNHICYLVHTMRVFYDMFDTAFPDAGPLLQEQRRLIQMLDTAALQPARLRGTYAIGAEVACRLRTFNGLDSTVLHPPTSLTGFRHGAFRYLLMPGRLHRWKRVDLAIKAMHLVTAPIELIIPGDGEDARLLRELAADDQRIHFPGRVSDTALLDLYADALAVLFLPQREDLGLVAFEAFLSGKPVITCSDSGEPARIVSHGVSGFVCAPEPTEIATYIEALAADPAEAMAKGARGEASIASITWARVGKTMATALGFGSGF